MRFISNNGKTTDDMLDALINLLKDKHIIEEQEMQALFALQPFHQK